MTAALEEADKHPRGKEKSHPREQKKISEGGVLRDLARLD